MLNIYIGQNQNDTHTNNQHKVTCNPAFDAACDNELSNSFASNHCDSNHCLYFLYNKMNNHQNHYVHSNNSANLAQ